MQRPSVKEMGNLGGEYGGKGKTRYFWSHQGTLRRRDFVFYLWAYADKNAHGMQTICKGAPQRGSHYGGMWGSYANSCGKFIPKLERPYKSIATLTERCGDLG